MTKEKIRAELRLKKIRYQRQLEPLKQIDKKMANGILYKVDPNLHPDLQKNRTSDLRKSGPYTKIHCIS